MSEDLCSTFIYEISKGLLLEHCYVLSLARSLEQSLLKKVDNFLVDLESQRFSLKEALTDYENCWIIRLPILAAFIM